MTVIEDTVKAYRTKQITMDEAREALRQFPVVRRTPPPNNNPWINDFDDDGTDGTFIELSAAARIYDLTPDEYEGFRQSLAAAPTETGGRTSRDPHVPTTTDTPPSLMEQLGEGEDEQPVILPTDYQGQDPPPVGYDDES